MCYASRVQGGWVCVGVDSLRRAGHPGCASLALFASSSSSWAGRREKQLQSMPGSAGGARLACYFFFIFVSVLTSLSLGRAAWLQLVDVLPGCFGVSPFRLFLSNKFVCPCFVHSRSAAALSAKRNGRFVSDGRRGEAQHDCRSNRPVTNSGIPITQ